MGQKRQFILNMDLAVNLKAGDNVLMGVTEDMDSTTAEVIIDHLKKEYPGVLFTVMSGVQTLAVTRRAEVKAGKEGEKELREAIRQVLNEDRERQA